MPRTNRRSLLGLVVAGGAACGLLSSVDFVGTPGVARSVDSRVARRVSAEYLTRQGERDADVPYTATDATGATHDVTYKKRPFGILRYSPDKGGKGAMVQEVVPKSRYPGDPQGQAFVAGVKGGWVVKSINGQDVTGEDFGKVMDMLDDEVADPRFSKSTALALEKQGGRMAEPVDAPIEVVYAEIPGYEWKGEVPSEDGQEGFAR
eukprot:TRINITY_DN2803_c0_g2_i1.p1 TRINITY_DN2803_c0_g2~~TRINITY_DN2803_c0_g2_i1.p1  ORF type:complete len:206 (-),score=46.87 TRINITY_DN2803_c0_g2_i1:237-854(-)